MAASQRNVRLPVELDERFSQFCEKTRRDEPFTIRAIVELFFADGDEAAERRLSSGVWNVPAGDLAAELEAAIEDKRTKKRKSG